ncbi:MAG: t-SNARE complex subunit (syntaxin) [Planctomycetota bacterium]|jgi:t-SNARE complex subunit (syntaxin)
MKKFLLTSAVLLALGACGSQYEVPSRIDTQLLREVPKDRKKQVKTALEASTVARDSYRIAREQTRVAGDAVGLSIQELDVVTGRIWTSRVALATARRGGASPVLNQLEAEYADLLGVGKIARLGLSLSRREHELAALRERLALEESRLTDARVELARANAVSDLDLTPQQSVPVEDMRDSVRFYEREVEIGHRRLSDGRLRMTQARADYESAIADARRADGPAGSSSATTPGN